MDNSRYKFRVWDKVNKKWLVYKKRIVGWQYPVDSLTKPFDIWVFESQDEQAFNELQYCIDNPNFEVTQYTGLKDKNELQEVYEGDIIDTYGKIKGNIYQMDKEEADLVVQGFGTKDWCETYSRAIFLGCKNAQ